MLLARPAKVENTGSRAQVVAAGRFKEARPLLVVIDDDADMAVGGLVGPAIARQMPRVAAFVERRLVGQAAHVVAHDETRHGLEHRNIQTLAASGAVAMHEACANRANRRETDDAIDQRVRNVARHAVAGLRHQRRQRGRALDQVVIGGLGGIGAILAEAEHAGIDQPRIDLQRRRRSRVAGASSPAAARCRSGRPRP